MQTIADLAAKSDQIGGIVQTITGIAEQTNLLAIAASVRGIADGAERMQGEIAEVATVAEASSASSEQVSAAAEQTSASMQEIAAPAQSLASTAEQLEQLVGRFRLHA